MILNKKLLLLTSLVLALSACSTVKPVDIPTVPKSTSHTSTDGTKQPRVTKAVTPRTEQPRAQKDFLYAFTQMGLETERNNNGFTVYLTGQNNSYFDLNNANLKPALSNALNNIASEANKSYLQNYRILVTGHTDNTGSSQFNQTLSNKRAKNVEEKLSSIGVNQSRLSSAGYGESKPRYSNPSQTQYNRRTDLVFIKN